MPNGPGNGSQHHHRQGGAGKGGHKRGREAGEDIADDRLRAWQEIFDKRGLAIVGTPECPPGYAEWAKHQGWGAFETDYSGYSGTPSTVISESTSVPDSRDEDDEYRQPRGQRAGTGAHSNAGSQYSQEMFNRLLDSVIRNGDKSSTPYSCSKPLLRAADGIAAELAAAAINSRFGQREWVPFNGKRSFNKQEPGPEPSKKARISKVAVSAEDAAKLRTRIDCRIAEYVAGRRAPNLSNRDLEVIAERQSKLIADETARRVKRAEQDAGKPSGTGGPKAKGSPAGSELDGEGEEEEAEASKGGPKPVGAQGEDVPKGSAN
ncbi:hypothetical protein AURDEDRAFT_128701 [Auricularia subglabra TFB-10046 SS5]|nr:hypothetical protein AURDEDRAFT_128701 [Auricularia subglabra TFB-10046 SS5]